MLSKREIKEYWDIRYMIYFRSGYLVLVILVDNKWIKYKLFSWGYFEFLICKFWVNKIVV